MRPPVRYARSGDVHVAYQVTGAGPVDIVLAPAFISHLDLAGIRRATSASSSASARSLG